MNDQIKDTWYYVIVQNTESAGEQLVGYTNKETGTTFIPAFNTKDMAQSCFFLMPKDIMNDKYEAQAIIKEDLMTEAGKNGYAVFLMDDKGCVLEQIS